MNSNIKILFTVFIIFAAFTGFTQDLPRLGQYMYNKQVYNPAAYGSGEAELNASLFYQNQWSSIEGAPTTFGGWADYRLSQKQMAVGLNVNIAEFGINKQRDYLLNYSYHLPITKKLKVSAGLRAGISNISVDPNDLENVRDTDDPLVDDLRYSSTFAKIGAGFQLYSSRFYAGIAAPDLFSGNKSFGVETTESTFKRANYVGYAGGIVELNDSYRLLPSMIAYISPNTESRVDGTVLLEVKQYFYAGATATTGNQYVVMGGAYLSPRLRFGYSYQFGNPGGAGNLSIHELNIRYLADNLFK